MKRNKSILIPLLLILGATACKKQVDVEAPETNPASATVYTKDATAASVLTSIYAKMAVNSFAQGNNGISLAAGLSADELQTYTQVATALYQNLYKNTITLNMQVMWKELYQQVYVCNAAIEGIAKSKGGMTDSVKRQLTGEARFMRAFLHFYATNLFGSVPYIDTTDYSVNARASKITKDQVLDRVIADLVVAKSLLPDNYVTPTGGTSTERLRPNKWTATAFLARAYLYKGEWAKAETEASAVIANTARFTLVTDITKVFVKESKESIWHISPVVVGAATVDGNTFVLTSAPNNSFPASLRPAFLTNFETNDKRRTNWVDSPLLSGTRYYTPGKYKQKTVPQTGSQVILSSEYLVVFRLAEQYLIRAEAKTRLDRVDDAKTDLNAVRTRAGLPNTAAVDKAELLLAIEKERQVELFTEWGHRWLDLKRTNRVDAVMTEVYPLKVSGGTWDTHRQLYPIPINELQLNPNLLPQNDGYN
jgi:starch-binding outer membrane protein, SusD/RagB family